MHGAELPLLLLMAAVAGRRSRDRDLWRFLVAPTIPGADRERS